MKRESSVILLVVIMLISGCQAGDIPPEPGAVQQSPVGEALRYIADVDPRYGPPFDIFNGDKQFFFAEPEVLEFDLDDPASWPDLGIEVEQEGRAIYRFGYYFSKGEWRQFTFPQETVRGSNWVRDSAKTTMHVDPGQFDEDVAYFVTYSCIKIDGEWKCGCRSPNDCGYWTLQTVDIERNTAGMPDLVVQNVGIESSDIVVGQKIKVIVDITNDGDAEAKGPFGVLVRSGPNTHRMEFPSLLPGRVARSTMYFSYDTPGDYEIVAHADDTGIVQEAEEGNNILGRAITVGTDLPDEPAFCGNDVCEAGEGYFCIEECTVCEEPRPLGTEYALVDKDGLLPHGLGFADLNIRSVTSQHLGFLKSSTLKNQFGQYTQTQYIELAPDTHWTWTKDPDDGSDEPAPFLVFNQYESAYKWQAAFTPAIKSGHYVDRRDLRDLENKQIRIFDKDYTVIRASHPAEQHLSLTLLGGAVQDTLEEYDGKTYTVDGKELPVKIVAIHDGTVKFDAGGEITDPLLRGEIYLLDNGIMIGVRDVLHAEEMEEGGKDIATFYLGADRLELTDMRTHDAGGGTSIVKHNGNELSQMLVDLIVTTEMGFGEEDHIYISGITIGYVPSQELYVPIDEGLLEVAEEIEGEVGNVLVEGFDIFFDGIDYPAVEEIKLKPSGSNNYKIQFTNKAGVDYDTEIFGWDGGMVLLGKMAGTSFRELVTDKTAPVADEDFVVIGDGKDDGYARILQFKSVQTADDIYRIKDVGTGEVYDVSYDSTGTGTLVVDGFSTTITGDGDDATWIFFSTAQQHVPTNFGATILFYSQDTIEVRSKMFRGYQENIRVTVMYDQAQNQLEIDIQSIDIMGRPVFDYKVGDESKYRGIVGAYGMGWEYDQEEFGQDSFMWIQPKSPLSAQVYVKQNRALIPCVSICRMICEEQCPEDCKQTKIEYVESLARPDIVSPTEEQEVQIEVRARGNAEGMEGLDIPMATIIGPGAPIQVRLEPDGPYCTGGGGDCPVPECICPTCEEGTVCEPCMCPVPPPCQYEIETTCYKSFKGSITRPFSEGRYMIIPTNLPDIDEEKVREGMLYSVSDAMIDEHIIRAGVGSFSFEDFEMNAEREGGFPVLQFMASYESESSAAIALALSFSSREESALFLKEILEQDDVEMVSTFGRYIYRMSETYNDLWFWNHENKLIAVFLEGESDKDVDGMQLLREYLKMHGGIADCFSQCEDVLELCEDDSQSCLESHEQCVMECLPAFPSCVEKGGICRESCAQGETSQGPMDCNQGACCKGEGLTFSYLHLQPEFVALREECEGPVACNMLYADEGVKNNLPRAVSDVKVRMTVPTLGFSEEQVIDNIPAGYVGSVKEQFHFEIPPGTQSGIYDVQFSIIYEDDGSAQVITQSFKREIAREEDMECVDEDGNDYYDKAQIDVYFPSGEKKVMQDACCANCHTAPSDEGPWVSEYVCDGKLWDRDIHQCPSGCKNGACVGSPEQLDLGDFPRYLIDDDGVFNGIVVVGDHSKAQDIFTMTEIMAMLQQNAVKKDVIDGIPRTTVVPIPVYALKLASEVADYAAQHVISVGLPCVNSVAAGVMGNPVQCTEGIPEHAGTIKMVDTGKGYVAVLVMGLDDPKTKAAGEALIGWKNHKLTGMEMCAQLNGEHDLSVGKCEEMSSLNDICENFHHDTCPDYCIKRCVSSVCEDDVCTDDCGGPGSCVTPTGCKDSDGGMSPYQAGGIVNGPQNIFHDTCDEDYELWEYKCFGPQGHEGRKVYCAHGCDNGKCSPVNLQMVALEEEKPIDYVLMSMEEHPDFLSWMRNPGFLPMEMYGEALMGLDIQDVESVYSAVYQKPGEHRDIGVMTISFISASTLDLALPDFLALVEEQDVDRFVLLKKNEHLVMVWADSDSEHDIIVDVAGDLVTRLGLQYVDSSSGGGGGGGGFVPERCALVSGINCADMSLTPEQLRLKVVNGIGNDITITGLAFVNEDGAVGVEYCGNEEDIAIAIAPGEDGIIEVECDIVGENDDRYEGKLFLNYRDEATLFDHEVHGELRIYLDAAVGGGGGGGS
ncbi:MAG: CARDB domain-containing protein [archaeon]